MSLPQTAKRFQRDPLLVDLVGEENTGKLADTISLMTMTVRGLWRERHGMLLVVTSAVRVPVVHAEEAAAGMPAAAAASAAAHYHPICYYPQNHPSHM